MGYKYLVRSLLCLLPLSFASAAVAGSYTFYVIPVSGFEVYATALSDNDRVLGYYSPYPNTLATYAWKLDDQAASELPSRANWGSTAPIAYAVNNSGIAIGAAFAQSNGAYSGPFVANLQNETIAEPIPEGVVGDVVLTGVNNRSEIVGYSINQYALIRSAGHWRSVNPPHAISSRFVSINNEGVALGILEFKRAYPNSPGEMLFTYDRSGLITSIKLPRNAFAGTVSIHDNGEIAGYLLFSKGPGMPYSAPKGFIYSNGKFAFVHVPGYAGDASDVVAVNKTGTYICENGSCFVGRGGNYHALRGPVSGFTLVSVNNNGDYIGYYYEHAFLAYCAPADRPCL